MYTNNHLPQPGRGRRTYSPEFKAQLVAACRIPGMSVASVARNHGINHNILHRWLRELPEPGALRLPQTTHKAVPAFIELPITEPIATAAVAVDSVRVEIQQGDL
jgi:transposase-like protein